MIHDHKFQEIGGGYIVRGSLKKCHWAFTEYCP